MIFAWQGVGRCGEINGVEHWDKECWIGNGVWMLWESAKWANCYCSQQSFEMATTPKPTTLNSHYNLDKTSYIVTIRSFPFPFANFPRIFSSFKLLCVFRFFVGYSTATKMIFAQNQHFRMSFILRGNHLFVRRWHNVGVTAETCVTPSDLINFWRIFR